MIFNSIYLVFVASLIASIHCLPKEITAVSGELKLPDTDDATAKGYQLLLGSDKEALAKLPHFIKTYGQLGINFDIDKGQPFIWCEVRPFPSLLIFIDF
jgi:hypothetical protein